MRETINEIKRKARELINRFAWQRQYKSIVAEPRKTNFVINQDWYKGSKILMMVPHADDELISSFSILCDADNVTMYYCGFTGSNNSEENRIRRRGEILRLCDDLNIRIIEGNRACDNLEDVIRGGEYEAILLPSIVDWHEEHRRVNYLIKDACVHLNVCPCIYSYSVTVPNESSSDVLCVPLSEEQLNRKYAIFKRIYLSQKVMPLMRLKLNERINGYHSSCYSAEVFSRHDFDGWVCMINRVEALESVENSNLRLFASDLYMNLNNLETIRKSSKVFNNWLEEENVKIKK